MYVYAFVRIKVQKKCISVYGRSLENDYILFVIPDLKSPNFSVFFPTFLTDSCKGIIKNLGVGKFCPNSKFPNKSSSGLTSLDCTLLY